MDERKRFFQGDAVGAIYAYWRQRDVGYSQVEVMERTVEAMVLFPNSLVFVLANTGLNSNFC